MTFRKGLSFLLFIFVFSGMIGTGIAEPGEIPAPVGDIYVQDFAKVLSKEEKKELIRLGKALEDQTTAQVAVLIVRTTEETPIEEYANNAYRQYQLGSKEENNGVLLVLALDDRQLRIEVGYGLEGAIPDGKAGRIRDEVALPALQQGKPNQAITDTYQALAAEVAAEYGVTDWDQQTDSKSEKKSTGLPIWLIIILVIVAAYLDYKFFGGILLQTLFSFLSSRSREEDGPRRGGGGSSGGGGASGGW